MLRRPSFKPHLRVETLPGEGIFLISEVSQTALQGRLYELVAPCLDGRSVEEVCHQLRGLASPAQVYYTVNLLEQKGYLVERDLSAPCRAHLGEAAFWTIQGIDPAQAARRLAELSVSVEAVGEVDPGPFRALLQAMNVRLTAPEEPGDFTVVLTDSYLRAALQDCNASALRTGKPWLLVKPAGCSVGVGPHFQPGRTACWACLAQRIRANAPLLAYLAARCGGAGSADLAPCGTPATLQVGYGLAAQAVVSWIGRGEEPTQEARLTTLDLLTGQSATHTLIRQPTCPACGSCQGPGAGRPVRLAPCPKVYTEDGGHRAFTPQQMLDRHGHHVSPLTGAVPALERDRVSGDGVIHVYLSGHNSARSPRSWSLLRSDLRRSNSGKGTTDVQARASALGEGLERYSAVFRGDEPRRKARLVDLGDEGIHPNACLHFSEKQYRDREAWNARGGRYEEVPEPFDPEVEMEWTPLWSLTRNCFRYLPSALCYFNYPQDDPVYCWSDSNGNAAGSTLEEAILQGFLELVERDSVALWWYNQVRRPGVDLDSFGDPYLGHLRAFLARRHRDLWALDLTADLGIPAFAAISRRIKGGQEEIMLGFGAHLDARVALLRAVTELNQMLCHVLDVPGGAAASGTLTDKETQQWLQTATLANQPYLVPQDGPPRTASSYPPCETDDLRDDVLSCRARVEQLGMEMLVLDQTRPEIGLPVVKVMVPGLRHFWARLAPGRLYHVPVQLGWLPAPLAEEQLNPVPMFL